MQVCFDEICRKEVIDMISGERLGFIDDVELDISGGRITSLSYSAAADFSVSLAGTMIRY